MASHSERVLPVGPAWRLEVNESVRLWNLRRLADLIGHEQSYRRSVRIVAVDLSVGPASAYVVDARLANR